MFMLAGKVALVTGSTSGIGKGIAEALARAGCSVILNGFGDADEIERFRAELSEKYGETVGYIGADVAIPEEVRAMISDAVQDYGSIDILVNNAGIQFTAPIEQFPEEQWDKILAINLTAAFHSIKAALPGMRAKRWGRIINIASVHGLVASTDKSAYVAAKHGLVGLTKAVALETANDGITINAICPGWVSTPLVEKQVVARAEVAGMSFEEAQNRLLAEKQPMLQFSTPEHIGELAVFLSGDAASTITGTTISMDGGWSAR
jgi:3-hydroxybutyrate dehydrogenase